MVLALERIISLAKDAETGQRGYLITGEERYLAPYRGAVGALGDQLKLLENLTANNSNCTADSPRSRRASRLEWRSCGEAIESRRSHGFTVAGRAHH